MAKSTIEVQLPHPFDLPGGEVADTAVIGLMTIKDRRELQRRFPSDKKADDRLLWIVKKRLVRLGPLDAPIDDEIIDMMPTSDFDYLLEAMWALDAGYDSVEAFRESDDYPR